MKKLFITAILLPMMAGCATIQDSITNTIQSSVDDTIQKAEHKTKDKIQEVINDNLSGGLKEATLHNPFQLKTGQSGYIKSEDLRIKFTEVAEESRCPSDVQCIQAGQFTATINLKRGENDLGDHSISL